jgi:hypothetical protein
MSQNVTPSLIDAYIYTYIYMCVCVCVCVCVCFNFSVAQQPPVGWPGPLHLRGFTITLRHIALARTHLDEWSARRRDLTTHNTHKRKTTVPPAGFKPAIPAAERPQTYALGREATVIGIYIYIYMCVCVCVCVCVGGGLSELPTKWRELHMY